MLNKAGKVMARSSSKLPRSHCDRGLAPPLLVDRFRCRAAAVKASEQGQVQAESGRDVAPLAGEESTKLKRRVLLESGLF